MKILKYVGLLMALTLPLMAAKCDEQLRSVLTQTCDGLNVAYAHYDALVDGGVISTSRQAKIAVVRQQTDALCANPGSATTVSVTAIAARAYVQLSAAFREAGNAPAAKLGYSKVENLRKVLEEAKKKE